MRDTKFLREIAKECRRLAQAASGETALDLLVMAERYEIEALALLARLDVKQAGHPAPNR